MIPWMKFELLYLWDMDYSIKDEIAEMGYGFRIVFIGIFDKKR